MIPISRKKARTLINGLTYGDCRDWKRGLTDWYINLPGIGYVVVGEVARTLVLQGTDGKQIAYRVGGVSYSGSKVNMSLSNGCILSIQVEDQKK